MIDAEKYREEAGPFTVIKVQPRKNRISPCQSKSIDSPGLPALAIEESIADLSNEGSSCSIELKSVCPSDESMQMGAEIDNRGYRGFCVADEELDGRIQVLYNKRKELGALNLSDKRELVRLVRIKNSRRFRKKEKLMKMSVKNDRNQLIQQDIQIQYLR